MKNELPPTFKLRQEEAQQELDRKRDGLIHAGKIVSFEGFRILLRPLLPLFLPARKIRLGDNFESAAYEFEYAAMKYSAFDEPTSEILQETENLTLKPCNWKEKEAVIAGKVKGHELELTLSQNDNRFIPPKLHGELDGHSLIMRDSVFLWSRYYPTLARRNLIKKLQNEQAKDEAIKIEEQKKIEQARQYEIIVAPLIAKLIHGSSSGK